MFESSRSRPFLFGILCCIAALGHAPAWVHVWCCNDPICVGDAVDQGPDTSTSCAFGCTHHHDAGKQSTDAKCDGHDSGHQHDDGTCSICQSLSAASGVTWKRDVSLATRVFETLLFHLPQQLRFATFRLVAAPRGPPSVV